RIARTMAQTWRGPFAINRLLFRLNGTTVVGAGEGGRGRCGKTFLSALMEDFSMGAMRSFASSTSDTAAAQNDARF
ncbi:MAG TPA: hypothetical protein P5179_04585, partial [Candidatus Latescibacteria bacterium]|nr:hypothetical protein [Candidatus Latescibacterota bacterium]